VPIAFLTSLNLKGSNASESYDLQSISRRINPMKFSNLLLIAAVSGGLMAQDTPAPGKMAKETSMTGCLSKGAGDGYVLTNEKTGRTVPVKGPSELEKHAANHKVKLTGTTTTEGGKPVLNVTKIDHISETCEAAKK
jgi:hypothetical protein